MERYIAKSVEILPLLWEKYGGYICRNIINARMLHKNGRCFLEVTTRNGNGEFGDETVIRVDLTEVAEGNNGPMFSGEKSAFVTARQFIEDFEAYDLLMCTPLFTEEAGSFINERYHGSEIKKA